MMLLCLVEGGRSMIMLWCRLFEFDRFVTTLAQDFSGICINRFDMSCALTRWFGSNRAIELCH